VYPNKENAMKKSILLATLMLAAVSSAFGQNCSFNPAPATAAFGNYSVFPSGPPQTTTISWNVQCSSNGVQVTVSFSRGINSASFNPRTMMNAGGTTLNYNLYTDAANTQIWGDGTGGTVSQTYTMGASQSTLPASVPIYASLPLGQNVGSGAYTDTITATLSWIRGSNPATTTVTFNVTATVVGDCTVSAFAINFGTYEPVVTNSTVPLDSTTTINVYCTAGTSGTVSLDNGSNFSGGARRMQSAAGAFMTYEIYKDAGHSTVWNAVGVNSATSTNKTIPLGGGFIAYGRIPAGQDLAAGAYNDTLQAIVTY
jgi:spore coat protein U domain-containing protein, fimbrial subunit CupE1/2/3/6